MAKMSTIFVFDLETSSVDTKTTLILQMAGVAVNPHKLEIIEGSEFNTTIKPELEKTSCKDLDEFMKVHKGALDVNKLTKQQLEEAPTIDSVWSRWVNHIQRYNPNPKTTWGAPTAGGKNIIGFDLPIIQRYCERFGQVDKEGRQTLFSPRNPLDLEQDIFRFFGWNDEMANGKMDTIREYFGMSAVGAHTALQDVKDTTALICKFQKLYREIFKRVKFKDSMKGA